MNARLICFLVAATSGLGLIFSDDKVEKHEPIRTGSELCAELTVEVNISASRGLLNQQEADRISARCWQLYGGSNIG